MRQKRGAIELSTNFIVMLIISIIVFGFAIYMVTRIFSFAEEERLRLDQQTESMIESALDRGDRVFIPRERRTLYPGDTGVFGMGILNVLGTGVDKFGVLVNFTKAFDKSDTQICGYAACINNMNRGLLSTAGGGIDKGLFIEKTIPNNEQATFLIGIKVPEAAVSGTYIYNLYVAYDRDTPSNGIQCDDFGATGDPPPNCLIADSSNLYDSQIHKLYVVVP